MAKIYHKEFKQKLDDKNKIDWTNEPRHENKYKTNLEAKRKYFKNILQEIINTNKSKGWINPIVLGIPFMPRKLIIKTYKKP